MTSNPYMDSLLAARAADEGRDRSGSEGKVMDDGKLLSTYDDAAPTPDAHLAGLRAVAKAARAKAENEIERLRAKNIELRDWRDTAVANCGKRRCSERDAELRRMTEKVDEFDRLRALLAEALPELLGEFWDETRYCRTCLGYDGHKDDCLVPRIDAALGGEAQP